MKRIVDGRKPITVMSRQYKTIPPNVKSGILINDGVIFSSSSPCSVNSVLFLPLKIIVIENRKSNPINIYGKTAASGIRFLVNRNNRARNKMRKMPMPTSWFTVLFNIHTPVKIGNSQKLTDHVSFCELNKLIAQ